MNKNPSFKQSGDLNLFAILPFICSALLLLTLSYVLFRGDGLLTKHYESQPPELTDYMSIAMEEGDELVQPVVPHNLGLYGLSLFLIKEEQIQSGDFVVRVFEETGNRESAIVESRRPITDIPNAEWFFFPLHVRFRPGSPYRFSYSIENITTGGDEKGKIYLLTIPIEYANESQNIATCDAVSLNRHTESGSVAQAFQALYPVSTPGKIAILLAAACILLWFSLAQYKRLAASAKQEHVTEAKLRAWLLKHFYPLCIVSAVFLSAVIRYDCLDFTSDDYVSYFYVWWRHYRELGFVDGMGTMPIDYYVPFNFLLAVSATLGIRPRFTIFFVTTLADYGIGYFSMRLVGLIRKNERAVSPASRFLPVLTGLVMVFLPPLWLNSAMWKQIDSIYICFCLIATYFALKNAYTRAFVFLAIAFTVKLQAIFLLPFFILLYLMKGGFGIHKFLYVPVGYLLAGVPALLCGADPKDIYLTYFDQLSVHPTMTEAFPNIYSLYIEKYEMFGSIAVYLTAGIFVLTAAYVVYRKNRFDLRLYLLLAAWCVWTCPMFLSNMRERYDLMAVVFISAIAVGIEHQLLPLAIFLNISSTICQARYLQWIHGVVNYQALAAFYAIAYFSFTLYLLWRVERGSSLLSS